MVGEKRDDLALLMRHFIFSLLLGLFLCSSAFLSAQETEGASENPAYEKELAETYGADDYGMKTYVMAFLKKGPNRDMDKQEAQDLQAAHMANINRLAEEGKLVLAGPFMGEGELRGIYIFDVATLEEAEALTNTDPAIQAGSLVMDLQLWYGSAAVMAIPELHDKVSKIRF